MKGWCSIVTYEELKQKHQTEFETFPMLFAYGDEQFKQVMEKLGLRPDELDKIYLFGESGGIYLRTDAPALHEMLARQKNEIREAMNSYSFALDAFVCELTNHEYLATEETDETLEALYLDMETVAASKKLTRALNEAIRLLWKYDPFSQRRRSHA